MATSVDDRWGELDRQAMLNTAGAATSDVSVRTSDFAGSSLDDRRSASDGAFARVGRRTAVVGHRTPFLKRAFDVMVAGFGLFASAPLWALVAALVKLEDGGPVFYRQVRVGQDGQLFEVLKFRSMVPDAEAATGQVQSGLHDPRVTRIGRIMRATAMDELPQLWNIFRGDMSFVGPRALRPGEIEARADRMVRLETVPGYDVRQQVVPGLTGVAQVYAARDVPARHKFRFDLVYVRRQSLLLDLKLILLSFWISARGKWEVRGRKF